MPDLDDELSELQRRAYGPGGEELGTDERARLAVLEAARRMPPPMESAPMPPRPPLPAAAVGAVPADPIGPKPEESLPATDRSAARLRWLTPALVAAIGVGAVIVMLVAGGMGWGAGYLAGVMRATDPGDEFHPLAPLRATPIPDELRDADDGVFGDFVDPETGDIGESVTYFGAPVAGTHLFALVGSDDDATSFGLREGQACLMLYRLPDDGQTVAHASSYCGSQRLGIELDVVVTNEPDGQGNQLVTDEFAPDTRLRFVYRAHPEIVTVWSAEPVAASE